MTDLQMKLLAQQIWTHHGEVIEIKMQKYGTPSGSKYSSEFRNLFLYFIMHTVLT